MEQQITFFFNGEEYYTKENITLLQLLNYFNYHSSIFVVEYNNYICEKTKWDKILIKKNDSIEIITIVGGG
jgi:thiamine biosynthesis protein ThiS